MSLVTISYEGNVIHEADYNGVVRLNTKNEYLDDDIDIVISGEEVLDPADGVSF